MSLVWAWLQISGYLGIYEYLYLLNSVLNAIRGEKSGEIKKRNALVKCRDG